MNAVKIFLAEDDDDDARRVYEAVSVIYSDVLLHREKDVFKVLC